MPWSGIRDRVVTGFFEWVVPTAGLMLLGATTVLVWLQVGHRPTFAILDVALPALLVGIIVYQGLRMQREGLSLDQTGVVAAWFGLGLLTMFAFSLWGVFLDVLGQGEIPRGVQVLTQVAAGGLFGLLVGIYGVRARQSASDAAEARVEQEFLERQQDTNELLNSILRHHLLNSLTIIRGNLQIVADHVDDEASDRVETVATRADQMTETIEEIRSITRTLTEDPKLRSVDLVGTLADEVETLEDRYPDATIRREWPPECTVAANDLLGRALRNVLHNAIEHNNGEPTVVVRVEKDEPAVVTVADDGPGIPPDDREEVLEPSTRGFDSDGEGLGLFLTRSVVEQYGGAVTIADSDLGGAAIEVRVPREPPG